MGLLLFSLVGAHANTVNLAYLEGRLPVAPDAIAALGPELFGDKINLFNGALSFEHADLGLPGNNDLPVALVRTANPGQDSIVRGQFGDWDANTPRIGGSFSSVYEWVNQQRSTNRCAGGLMPPTLQSGGVSFIASDYWSGTYLHVPGAGNQEVLTRSGGYATAPADGLNYPYVTHQNWQTRCC